MGLRTIVGVVVETEAAEEEDVAVAIETETDTFLVEPPEMAEELLDLIGHRVRVTGTVADEDVLEPTIDVDEYTLLYDEEEDEEGEEEEEEEEAAAAPAGAETDDADLDDADDDLQG